VLPLTAFEQRAPPRRPRRIGFLVFYDAPTLVKAFEEEMRRLGYVEGKNIVIEKRASRPNTSDLSAQAAELARMDLSLIVAGALPQALEVRKDNRAMPMVIATCLHVGDDIRVAIAELLLSYPSIAGVIRSGDEPLVSVELPHQRGEVARASRNVLLGIERVACSESLCRRGHQLHQSYRAFV
jgi:hypothetical protein